MTHCDDCERCTWNPGPDCGKQDHPHCTRCGHCSGRHADQDHQPERFDGFDTSVYSECGHDPVRLTSQAPVPLPKVGDYGICWCDEERERKVTAVETDAQAPTDP